eukprot:86328-Pelagomonas_calceolata.AAC.4
MAAKHNWKKDGGSIGIERPIVMASLKPNRRFSPFRWSTQSISLEFNNIPYRFKIITDRDIQFDDGHKWGGPEGGPASLEELLATFSSLHPQISCNSIKWSKRVLNGSVLPLNKLQCKVCRTEHPDYAMLQAFQQCLML